MLNADKNIQVFFTSEPMKAVDLAVEIEPDVILLDILMPCLDGIEVRRQLLLHSHTCDIPIIFLTSSNYCDVKVESKTVGCLTYMQKPADRDDLITNIKASQAIRYISKALDSISEARKEINQA
jgi:CheY-like chemotaxis protein